MKNCERLFKSLQALACRSSAPGDWQDGATRPETLMSSGGPSPRGEAVDCYWTESPIIAAKKFSAPAEMLVTRRSMSWAI